MNRRGFTLLEALVSLFLIGLVVVLSAGLLHGMSSMGRRNQTGEQAVNGLLALERVRAEVLEAVSITEPSGASEANTLIFKKINPAITNRLQLPGYSWNPALPAHLLTISYTVTAGDLIRTVTPDSGAGEKSVVARSVDSFTAKAKFSVPPVAEKPETLTLQMSFSKGKVLDTYTTVVKRILP